MSKSDVATVVFAALVLMAAGGLIAYLGDRWGYAWGKKRLSLFGMRPKKTASFLTVITGVAIALLTLAVLLIINAGFRTALTHGATIIRNLHHNKLEIRVYVATIQLLKGQETSLQREEDQDRMLAQQEAARVKAARGSLAKARTELAQGKAKLHAIHGQLQLADANVATAQARVRSLRQQEATLTRINGVLDANVNWRIKNPLIYTNGAEVGRTVIASDDGESSIRRELIYFLEDLSAKAERMGAVTGRNHRAVEVASIRIGASPTFAQESDSLNALAQQIHAHGGGSVAVIAYAAGNAFAKKPVYVRLQPYANRLVIPAGTVLGETVIPGEQKGVAEILSDMQTFLKGPVHQTALRRGVIPVLPENDIGNWGPGEIDPMVSQVQQTKGDAVVVVLAAKDIYAADQVSLDFTVRPAASQPVATPISNP